MSPDTQKLAKGKFTGRHMMFAMLAFFGVIIAVNVTMAVLASGTWTGLVVKNSYVASQHFNEELQAAKLQQQSGTHSEISYTNGTLQIEIFDKDGKPLPTNSLAASIGRPAFEQADKTVTFPEQNTTLNKAVTELEEGMWAVSVTAMVFNQPYRRDFELHVDTDGNGRVQ